MKSSHFASAPMWSSKEGMKSVLIHAMCNLDLERRNAVKEAICEFSIEFGRVVFLSCSDRSPFERFHHVLSRIVCG